MAETRHDLPGAGSHNLLGRDNPRHGLSDPVVIARHLERLQEFDLVSQMLIEMAALLTAEDPVATLGEVKLSDLHRRPTKTAP